ncbi:MAG: MBL fold metallo-hydrolase [Candidatus Thorarchaeota archaeon]
MKIEKREFESIYFDLYELKPGIFTTMAYVSANAGFFDLGNYTIIFDTLMDPYATEDLIKASKQFTNKDPAFLINSHFHIDHLYGNRKFDTSIPIISSYETLKEYHRTTEDILNRFREQGDADLKRIDEELKKETDPKKILEMKNDINSYTEMKDPNFKLRAPDFIISDSITIEGTSGKVELIYIGAAHSPGDLIGYFEKEKICFMGDLLFQETDPSWVSGPNPMPFTVNPERFRDFLQEYLQKDIEIFVPGHGKLCTKKELEDSIKFLEEYYIKN